MPKRDSRAGQLNAVIDPKLLFLAKRQHVTTGSPLANSLKMRSGKRSHPQHVEERTCSTALTRLTKARFSVVVRTPLA